MTSLFFWPLRWHGTNTGQISTTRGTFLKDVNLFDNVEFGVSVKDARAMAASTRKLIEHSFLALYDSGIDYRSRNIGCFTAGSVYSITNVSETVSYSYLLSAFMLDLKVLTRTSRTNSMRKDHSRELLP